MKKGLLLTLVLLCSATLVFAQVEPGSVAVYSDPGGTNCNLTEPGGMAFLYYFLAGSPGASGVEFSTDITGVVAWSHVASVLSDSNWLLIGDFLSGASVAWGDCLSGNIYLGYEILNAIGPSPACSYIYVTGHPVPSIPGETHPIYSDCGPSGGELHVIHGSYMAINPDETCQCPGTIPAEESSWGHIKALYE